MKKLFSLFLIIFVLFTCTACHKRPSGTVDANADVPVVILFAGLDEAAENTDVLFLLSIDPSNSRLSLMQIPRDTYVAIPDSQNKINGIYAAKRYQGASRKEALSYLGDQISRLLSIPITGSVAFTAAVLRTAVDAMGGVSILLPQDFVIGDKCYGAGEHLLCGEEAEQLVRHRETYAMGDLARVDVQKLVLSAMLRSARTELAPRDIIRLLLSMQGDLITDLSPTRALSLGVWAHSRLSACSPVFFTLPGEPLSYRGHWYYVVNRPCSEELIASYFPFGSAFDPSHLLYDGEDVSHTNIYRDPGFQARVYSEEDLASLKIKTKKNE